MKKWLIKILGGYPDIDSLLEVVDKHEDKHKILTEAVKHLFNTIGADDILQENSKGEWRYGDKTLLPAQQKLLIAEAKVFLTTRLWKVLQDDVKHQLNKRMYTLSKNENDLIAGKIGLFVLDALRTRLNSLDKESGRFNKPTV